MPPAQSSTPNLWTALPGLLWLALAVVLLVVLRKELRQILSELAWRLRSGVALKIASVELGSIVVVPGGEVSPGRRKSACVPTQIMFGSGSGQPTVRRPATSCWSTVCTSPVRLGNCTTWLSTLCPQGGVSRRSISSRVFPWVVLGQQDLPLSRSKSRICAHHGRLWTNALHRGSIFNDGTNVILHRYIDFEMGASAPARVAG